MSRLFLFAILSVCFLAPAFAADCPPKLFEPPGSPSPDTMFFIQKSNNANTVYYDLNLTKDGLINPKTPLNVYWRMFAQKGQKESLGFLERKLAFGINNVKEVAPGHKYTARIASMDRDIAITYENGCGIVTTLIDGREGRLEKIMLELEGPVYFPTLIYMDIYGQNLETGAEVHERWYHK